MKKILLLIYMMFPVLVMAQGHKGEVDECAPMKNGKVCYSDDVEIENTSKLEIFNAINAWAKKSYGKDVFLSNVNSNKFSTKKKVALQNSLGSLISAIVLLSPLLAITSSAL